MRTYIFLALFIAWNGTLKAQEYTVKDLKKYVEGELNTEALKHASVGVAVYNITKGEYVYEHNKELSLVPASIQKTITTATALEVLGEQYRYETFLEHDGTIDSKGKLGGHLYIRGTGDPTMGSSRFEGHPSYDTLMMQWADTLKAMGITSIEGKVIADASIYDYNHVPDAWQWNDLGNYYGASAQGLNINENVYRMVFAPNFRGNKAKLTGTEPEMKGMEVVNKVWTAGYGTGDRSYIYGSPFSDLRFIQGTIAASRKETKVRGAMPDPAYFMAQYLHELLEERGIEVRGTPTTIFREQREGREYRRNRKALYVYRSPEMGKIVQAINEWSVNIFAEGVLKTLGMRLAKTSNPDNSADAIEDYWKGRGFDVGGMFLQDGSGLSHTNAVTPKIMVELLSHYTKQAYFAAFYESLATAGEEGTLRHMCKGTKAEGNIRAKSGSMYRVACYTGYVDAPNGDRLCFVLMSNKHHTYYSAIKRRWEKVMIMLADLKLD